MLQLPELPTAGQAVDSAAVCHTVGTSVQLPCTTVSDRTIMAACRRMMDHVLKASVSYSRLAVRHTALILKVSCLESGSL